MAEYNGKDRRYSLGGISRQTFVRNAIEAFGESSEGFAGMLYDLQRCTDSKVQLANDKIDRNRDAVTELFDKHLQESSKNKLVCQNLFIKKVSPKIPLSWSGFIFAILSAGIAIGLGILTISNTFDFGMFKLFINR